MPELCFVSKLRPLIKLYTHGLLFSTGDTISYILGDNPVYGIPENRTNSITSETAEFNNPYGSLESLNDAELQFMEMQISKMYLMNWPLQYQTMRHL